MEKVNHTNAILQAFIESFKDVLIFSIDPSYSYLYFNASFKEATLAAYGTNVLAGASMLASITSDTEREKAKVACDRALKGESHFTIEVYGTLRPLYYKTRYNPIIDTTGNIIGVTVLAANITESKLAEERIAGLNQELEAFSYSIAHDLRAPLRSIHGFSEILMEEYHDKLDDEAQRLLRVISGNSRKMGNMVDDLLNFAKLGRSPVQKRNTNIELLLPKIIDDLMLTAGNRQVDFNIGTLHPLLCDDTLIRNVFTNLLSNAVKYSRYKQPATISVTSEVAEGGTTYCIRDNGAGFDMQYADKLFGVFSRLHKSSEFEGNGVGLAITQRIIVKHSGKIWAESVEGEGATFYFTLPNQ